MQKVNLYRYVDENNVTVTPMKHKSTDKPHMLRLIADQGKTLTNGTDTAPVIDILPADESLWSEVDYVEPLPEVFEP